MAPIRVLYVNHVSFISGAEESLLELLANLDREAVEPCLACPPGELATRARELEVDVASLPIAPFRRTHNPLTLSSYALNWMAGKGQLRKIFNVISPSIVHANSATAQIYAAPVAKKGGVPCLWHSRDLRPLQYPANTICRGADGIVAISQCVADFLKANGFFANLVTVIHNGINAERWRAAVTGRDIRADLALGAEARIILMAAQLAPWKRHEDAISAMPRILEHDPRVRLVLAGNDLWGEHPELEMALRAFAEELQVHDAVIFAGRRDDMPDLMDTAELVMIPSDAEPFGRVAIEAMALGKPVVGTRAGGLPEVVQDGKTGLLVVPRFPESLAGACVRLLENGSLARTLGNAGRELVARNFSTDKMSDAMIALYEKLLTSSLKWMPA